MDLACGVGNKTWHTSQHEIRPERHSGICLVYLIIQKDKSHLRHALCNFLILILQIHDSLMRYGKKKVHSIFYVFTGWSLKPYYALFPLKNLWIKMIAKWMKKNP